MLRLLPVLLCLVPVLGLAQPAPLAADAPLRALKPGQRVRVTADAVQHDGVLLGMDAEQLRLRPRDSREELRVPLSALGLLEVDDRTRAVKRGALFGGIGLGAAAALGVGLVCFAANGVADNGSELSTPACVLGSGLMGAAVGATVGALIGAVGPSWVQVWARPPRAAQPKP